MTTDSPQQYVVLLHGDMTAWLEADEQTKAATYRRHGEFTEECGRRGHTITGGAELAPSRTAIVVRQHDGGGAPHITDGPYTETVEQLGGYYLVETADVDDLARLAARLLDPGDVAEIRRALDNPDGGDS